MTPATALREPPAETMPVEEEAVETVQPVEEVRRKPASWYAGPEFQRLLMEHFTKARNAAIATNPPDAAG